MWILKILFRNLMLTILIEVPVGYAFGAKNCKKVITVLLANIITNPLVVFFRLCLILFLVNFETAGILILEILAFFAEGFMFSKFNIFGRKNPYFVSFVLNSASFLLGEIILLLL